MIVAGGTQGGQVECCEGVARGARFERSVEICGKVKSPPTPRSRPRAGEGGVNATNVCGARSFPSHGVRSMRLRNLPVDWIVVSGAIVGCVWKGHHRDHWHRIVESNLQHESPHGDRARARLSLEIALTVPGRVSKLTDMVVHLKPDTESRLQELAATTGRAPDELVEDAMAGYLAELAQVRNLLDGRYDEIKSGSVEPIDGEEAFNRLHRKSDDRRHS